MRKTRKHYTAHEKVAMLKRHLLEQVPVATICEEADLQPTVFYRWLKQFFEQGAVALERSNGQTTRPAVEAQRRIERLEARLQQKDAVLAELLEEHVGLKKSLGER